MRFATLLFVKNKSCAVRALASAAARPAESVWIDLIGLLVFWFYYPFLFCNPSSTFHLAFGSLVISRAGETFGKASQQASLKSFSIATIFWTHKRTQLWITFHYRNQVFVLVLVVASPKKNIKHNNSKNCETYFPQQNSFEFLLVLVCLTFFVVFHHR